MEGFVILIEYRFGDGDEILIFLSLLIIFLADRCCIRYESPNIYHSLFFDHTKILTAPLSNFSLINTRYTQ